jgi:hypothetical protein
MSGKAQKKTKGTFALIYRAFVGKILEVSTPLMGFSQFI